MRSGRTSYLLGIGAQVLTVASSLLPVAFGYGSALVFVIQVTAPVSVILATASLSAQMTLPSLKDEARALLFIRSAWLLTLLLAVSVILGAAIVLLVKLSVFLVNVLLGIAVLMIAQCSYVLMVSEMVRRADYEGTMRARLVYALLLSVSTLSCCIVAPVGWALLWCAVIAFATAASYGAVRTRLLPRFREARATVTWRAGEILRNWKAGAMLSGAQVVSGLSNQAVGLMIGSVGPGAALMAGCVRVTSGFQTVGGQLVAPRLDIDVSGELREHKSATFVRRKVLGAILVSLLLGSLAAVCSLGIILWQSEASVLSGSQLISLAIGATLFAFGAASLAPVDHLLTIVGRTGWRVAWDFARGGLTLSAVLLLAGANLILALGVVFLLGAVAYLALILGATYSRRPGSPVLRGLLTSFKSRNADGSG